MFHNDYNLKKKNINMNGHVPKFFGKSWFANRPQYVAQGAYYVYQWTRKRVREKGEEAVKGERSGDGKTITLYSGNEISWWVGGRRGFNLQCTIKAINHATIIIFTSMLALLWSNSRCLFKIDSLLTLKPPFSLLFFSHERTIVCLNACLSLTAVRPATALAVQSQHDTVLLA